LGKDEAGLRKDRSTYYVRRSTFGNEIRGLRVIRGRFLIPNVERRT